MRRVRILGLVLLLAYAGCAADGGQRGTGISSFAGNVVAVDRGGASPSGESTSGIIVTVEGTDLQTQTDGQGQFSLRGAFAGDTALRFTRAGDGLEARYSVNVPAGGTTTLRDVTLRTPSGEVAPTAVYVVFEGRVVGLDCAMDRLVCASVALPPDEVVDEDDTYVVELSDSSVHDSAGHTLGCEVFAVGDTMRIDGAYLLDGAIGQADIAKH